LSQRVVYRSGEEPLHWIRPDLAGTVVAGEHCTLVRWAVPAGAEPTPLHSHMEFEQISTILSGRIETTVGDESFILGPGDICHIRRGEVHGRTRALGEEAAIVLDIFTPPRQQYVEAAERSAKAEAATEGKVK
jgi:quercetin dioxygenase-like cupin family protein